MLGENEGLIVLILCAITTGTSDAPIIHNYTIFLGFLNRKVIFSRKALLQAFEQIWKLIQQQKQAQLKYAAVYQYFTKFKANLEI